MADASLDDFFAKKDKKKTTKKKADDGSKRSDEVKLEKPKKEKERPAVSIATKLIKTDQVGRPSFVRVTCWFTASVVQDDAEWKDVDDERDYSGLKISALTIK